MKLITSEQNCKLKHLIKVMIRLQYQRQHFKQINPTIVLSDKWFYYFFQRF